MGSRSVSRLTVHGAWIAVCLIVLSVGAVRASAMVASGETPSPSATDDVSANELGNDDGSRFADRRELGPGLVVERVRASMCLGEDRAAPD